MITSFRLWPAQDVPLSIFIKVASLKHVKVVLSSKIFSRSSFKMSHNSKVPTHYPNIESKNLACRLPVHSNTSFSSAFIDLPLGDKRNNLHRFAQPLSLSTLYQSTRKDLSFLSNLLCVSTFNQFTYIWIHQSNPFRYVSYIRTRCSSFYFEECLWIIEQCSSLGT